MAEVQTQIAAATTVASSSKPSKTYGLSFRRLFTKAGISPYDEVEWEKRTATIVDSKGNTYLLQRLGAKNLGGLAKDRINMSITLPGYIKDVAKVQIYCAWAEAVLGEAPFSAPLMTMNK